MLLSVSLLTFSSLSLDFQFKNITYLLGTADDVNCKIDKFQNCNDNELATNCQSMYQGNNRVDRMKKWINYLSYFYGYKVHRLVEVSNISHDPIAMINSKEGKCAVFGICE